MFGLTSRRKLQRVERRIARLEQQNAELLKQLQHSHQAAGYDPAAMIGVLLDAQGKQVESTSAFIRMIQEVAVERMASALGRRGGKKRAATAPRAANGRMLPGKRSDCVLCADPMSTSFSAAEFDDHQKHKNRREQPTSGRPGPAQRAREEEEEEVIDYGTKEAPHYPLPAINLSGGNEAGGTSGDSGTGDVDHGDHIHKADGSVVRKVDLPGLNGSSGR